MSDILYSKLRLEVPQALDGEDATITSSKGAVRTVEMSSPITDIVLAGMEKYRVQAGFTDESVAFGYGQIKKVEALVVPEIYNTVKNAIGNITEAQWLEFVDSGCIALARELGETSSFIGKNVTLSNSVVSNYTSWKIADFNHDSSGDTVDLIQNNTIYSTTFGNGQYYNGSTVRTWLLDTYLPGFSTNVKNKLQIMTVTTNGSDTSDKIKLLSGTEIGATHTYMLTGEGTKYPIFTSSSGISYDSSRARTGADTGGWWLRSRYTESAPNVWVVLSGGRLNYYYGTSNRYGVVPCIRFAQSVQGIKKPRYFYILSI